MSNPSSSSTEIRAALVAIVAAETVIRLLERCMPDRSEIRKIEFLVERVETSVRELETRGTGKEHLCALTECLIALTDTGRRYYHNRPPTAHE